MYTGVKSREDLGCEGVFAPKKKKSEAETLGANQSLPEG